MIIFIFFFSVVFTHLKFKFLNFSSFTREYYAHIFFFFEHICICVCVCVYIVIYSIRRTESNKIFIIGCSGSISSFTSPEKVLKYRFSPLNLNVQGASLRYLSFERIIAEWCVSYRSFSGCLIFFLLLFGFVLSCLRAF